ncbi:Arylsulfatase I [Portunus trituberculatus]|uniref:Arylsulfatase I n=2 Tax=Portunus trituberculatus TaxID=210409 RepID=A0A5B7GG19_PORTR|nr:Arylsulfatase I [Portunus trituberculatus]
MHVVDWRETLLHAARGPAHWPSHGAPDLQARRMREEADEMVEEEREGDDDSLDLWGALIHNAPSPRTSFVYNLRKGPLRGAIRRRHWKLVVGLGGRYDGWVPPEDVGSVGGVGHSSWTTPTTRHLPAHAPPSDTSDMVMLFNMRNDPLETTDLSGLYPEVVATLRAKLREYSRHSQHPHSPKDDPRGHPSLHGGFFSPGWCEPLV